MKQYFAAAVLEMLLFWLWLIVLLTPVWLGLIVIFLYTYFLGGN